MKLHANVQAEKNLEVAGNITASGTVKGAYVEGSDGVYSRYGFYIKRNDFLNDHARLYLHGTGNNGSLEIATTDDASEPIYVRQYQRDASNNEWTQIVNEAALLDAEGNTSFPGNLRVDGNIVTAGILNVGSITAHRSIVTEGAIATRSNLSVDGSCNVKGTLNAQAVNVLTTVPITPLIDGTSAMYQFPIDIYEQELTLEYTLSSGETTCFTVKVGTGDCPVNDAPTDLLGVSYDDHVYTLHVTFRSENIVTAAPVSYQIITSVVDELTKLQRTIETQNALIASLEARIAALEAK